MNAYSLGKSSFLIGLLTLQVGCTPLENIVNKIGNKDQEIAAVVEQQGQNDVWLFDGKPLRLTNDENHESSLSFSPDGLELAYISNFAETTGNELRILDVENRIYTTLLTDIDIARALDEISVETEYARVDALPFMERALWSPDGNSIAYTVYDPRPIQPIESLQVVDVETGGVTIISDPVFGVGTYDWSQDGSKLVYFTIKHIMATSILYLADLNTGEITQLTETSPELGPVFPQWMPDSRHVLYSQGRDSTHGIFMLNTETLEEECLTDKSIDIHDYSISPDGKQIAFTPEGFGANIHIMNLDSRQVKPLVSENVFEQLVKGGGIEFDDRTHPGYLALPKWSPDGKQISFLGPGKTQDSEFTWFLYRINADGTDLKQVIDSAFFLTPNYYFDWAP